MVQFLSAQADAEPKRQDPGGEFVSLKGPFAQIVYE